MNNNHYRLFEEQLFSYDHLYLPRSTSDFNWMYWYQYIYYPTYNRLDGLLVGVSIAALYRFLPATWNKLAHYGNLFIIMGILVLTVAYFLCQDLMNFNASVWGFPLIALGYGLMVTGAISPNSFLYKWKSKLTSFIATISYGLYLTHKGVIHITLTLLERFKIDANWMLLISMITCIISACILYLVIEQPFLKWRKKIVKA